jgi:hypothetical protein
MRKSLFDISIMALLAFTTTSLCPAQQATQADSQLFPIIYGSETDGLPLRIRASGTISQVDYASARCGELIFPATLEIKLDGKVSGYNHPFLYLIVPCLYRPEGAEKFLNQRIEIIAIKQDENRRPCFFDTGKTGIDSRGVPFYCADHKEILKAVSGHPVSSRKEPLEFTGTLEKGITYRALVIFDEAQEWRLVASLKMPRHHAARVEWLNLKEFPELSKQPSGSLLKRIVLKVAEKETIKVAGQYRWNDTYYCRIIAIE